MMALQELDLDILLFLTSIEIHTAAKLIERDP